MHEPLTHDRWTCGGKVLHRIAVIGSGIAGLSCAWLLSKAHHVTVYEAASRLGGHCNTVDVNLPAGPARVDTGFIVYNEASYPNLTALLAHLGVATQRSSMSFGVSLEGGRLEFTGTSLRAVLGQPANMLHPKFWATLRDLARFYKEAPLLGPALIDGSASLGAWLELAGSGAASALRNDPAAGFCDTHRLLKVVDRPAWRTVTGGCQTTVKALVAGLSGPVLPGRRVVGLTRDEDGVTVRDSQGDSCRFDHVVVATHGDQARAMLEDPSNAEARVLGAFRTTRNVAVLHTDRSFMPRRHSVWSSWNYVGAGVAARPQSAPSVTYWMNRLQRIPGPDMFLTLNPARPPADGAVLHAEHYDHPVFDPAVRVAQRAVWSLQGVRRTWFCGAHLGAGLHEDGLQTGLAVAEAIGGVRRPWADAHDSMVLAA